MLRLNLVLPLLDDRLCDVNIQGSRIPEGGGGTTSETCERYKVRRAQTMRTYVRFRSRASLGIMGDGAPSLSQWVGLDR